MRNFVPQTYSVKKKGKASKRSLFVPFSTDTVKNGETQTPKEREELKTYGIISFKHTPKSYYVLEIDMGKKDKIPHFHIWKASNRLRVSDTRSRGISLFSGLFGDGVVSYVSEEQKDKRRLKINEEKEICNFLSEDQNRFAIFCMIDAYKNGRQLPIISFNLEELLAFHDDGEIKRLSYEFSKLQEKQEQGYGKI